MSDTPSVCSNCLSKDEQISKLRRMLREARKECDEMEARVEQLVDGELRRRPR